MLMPMVLRFFAVISVFLLLSCGGDDEPENKMTTSVTVAFLAQETMGSEALGNNLPSVSVRGTVAIEVSVSVLLTNTGTATLGEDFSFASPTVISIPIGNYDGTALTAIPLPGLSILDDTVQEGFETIIFSLDNPTEGVNLGDVATTTYTINDDETVQVGFSQAMASDRENVGGNLPTLFVTGTLSDDKTITLTAVDSGGATLGQDYNVASPLVVTIPAGTYDGTTATALTIPALVIIDDTVTEESESFELTLSDPSNGLLLNELDRTMYTIEGVVPCENGRANGFPCNGYDLLARMEHSTFSSTQGNDIWGWTDTATGHEYALVALNNGTAFVDITADDPVYLGKLPSATGSSVWRDVKIYGNHAYIVSEASGHGMQVFDLTRLRNVANPPTDFTQDARYTGIGNAHNVVINEQNGFAYPVGTARNDTFNGGVHFVDIQNPTSPTAAGGYGDNGYTHDAQVVNYEGPDADYTGREIFIGANEDQIAIVDITDKANPTEIATITYGNLGYTHQGWFTEDQRFFLLGDELDEIDFGFNSRTLVFDLQDLDNPVLHTTYLGPTAAIDHNGYVHGDEFFLANYTAGVRVLDLSDIEGGILTEIGFFDTFPDNDVASFNGVWSVYPYFESGKIIVNDSDTGFFIIQKSQ